MKKVRTRAFDILVLMSMIVFVISMFCDKYNKLTADAPEWRMLAPFKLSRGSYR